LYLQTQSLEKSLNQQEQNLNKEIQQQAKELELLAQSMDDIQLEKKVEKFSQLYNWTREEVLSLRPIERITTPLDYTPKNVEYNRTLSSKFIEDLKGSNEPIPRYINLAHQAVLVDPNIAKPIILLKDTTLQYPKFSVKNIPEDASVYYEFDLAPTFDSQSLWRIPLLSTIHTRNDLGSRKDVSVHIFKIAHDIKPDRNGDLTFPFRASSMALPMGNLSSQFQDLARYAQLAGHGLSNNDIIKELFFIHALRFDQGGETYARTPYETFVAGMAECGNLVSLAGEMLEINNIRWRMVGGFHPAVRNVFEGGGHTGLEVLNEEGNWEYFDPYLGIYTPDKSIVDIATHKAGQIPIYSTPEGLIGKYGLDEKVRLENLFRYRIYLDRWNRTPMAHMTRLADKEAEYGHDIPLRKLKESEIFDPIEELPKKVTVYVRARYVISKRCSLSSFKMCGDQKARASEWSVKQFDIDPHSLLGIK